MVQRKRRKTEDPSKNDDNDVIDSSFSDLCIVLHRNYQNMDIETSEKLKDVLPSMIHASNVLKESIVTLQETIDRAKKLAIITSPVADTTDQAIQLIAYAHKLSFTTSAPPGFIPGKTPLMLFKPPAPQDVHMRSSILHSLQREFEERKRTAVYSEPTTTQQPTTTDQKQPQSQSIPPPPTTTTQLPSNLADILSSLPPMPEGWKPGDAIPGLPLAMTATDKTTVDNTITTKTTTTISIDTTTADVTDKDKEKSIFKPISVAFDFALNPDMEVEFEASDGDDDSSNSDDSDSD